MAHVTIQANIYQNRFCGKMTLLTSIYMYVYIYI